MKLDVQNQYRKVQSIESQHFYWKCLFTKPKQLLHARSRLGYVIRKCFSKLNFKSQIWESFWNTRTWVPSVETKFKLNVLSWALDWTVGSSCVPRDCSIYHYQWRNTFIQRYDSSSQQGMSRHDQFRPVWFDQDDACALSRTDWSSIGGCTQSRAHIDIWWRSIIVLTLRRVGPGFGSALNKLINCVCFFRYSNVGNCAAQMFALLWLETESDTSWREALARVSTRPLSCSLDELTTLISSVTFCNSIIHHVNCHQSKGKFLPVRRTVVGGNGSCLCWILHQPIGSGQNKNPIARGAQSPGPVYSALSQCVSRILCRGQSGRFHFSSKGIGARSLVSIHHERLPFRCISNVWQSWLYTQPTRRCGTLQKHPLRCLLGHFGLILGQSFLFGQDSAANSVYFSDCCWSPTWTCFHDRWFQNNLFKARNFRPLAWVCGIHDSSFGWWLHSANIVFIYQNLDAQIRGKSRENSSWIIDLIWQLS